MLAHEHACASCSKCATVLHMTDIVRARATAAGLLLPPEELRRLRLLARLSQEVSADACGVHRVTYARWESGDSVPRGDHVERLASFTSALVEGLAIA